MLSDLEMNACKRGEMLSDLEMNACKRGEMLSDVDMNACKRGEMLSDLDMNACKRGTRTGDFNGKGRPQSVLLHCRHVERSADVGSCVEYTSNDLTRKKSFEVLHCEMISN